LQSWCLSSTHAARAIGTLAQAFDQHDPQWCQQQGYADHGYRGLISLECNNCRAVANGDKHETELSDLRQQCPHIETVTP